MRTQVLAVGTPQRHEPVAESNAAGRVPAAPTAALQVLLGLCALALGVLVYLADRPAGTAAWIPPVAAVAGAHLFGVLGGWLPSFVHPFAFSLLTAATQPRRAAPAYAACIGWWAVNVAFEVGQHPALNTAVARALDTLAGGTGLARPFTRYLLRGTFDVGDLFAATAGALAAAGVLAIVHRRRIHHACG